MSIAGKNVTVTLTRQTENQKLKEGETNTSPQVEVKGKCIEDNDDFLSIEVTEAVKSFLGGNDWQVGDKVHISQQLIEKVV